MKGWSWVDYLLSWVVVSIGSCIMYTIWWVHTWNVMLACILATGALLGASEIFWRQLTFEFKKWSRFQRSLETETKTAYPYSTSHFTKGDRTR